MSKKRRRSKNIDSADEGLVENEVWEKSLKKYLQNQDKDILCSIREKLNNKISGLTEAFNKKSRYFGYWTGTDKDRAYIYVQKKGLRIDLCIKNKKKNEKEIRKIEDFTVKFVNNFQGQDDWLTGWHVPHSTTNIKPIVNWLCKAFEENL